MQSAVFAVFLTVSIVSAVVGWFSVADAAVNRNGGDSLVNSGADVVSVELPVTIHPPTDGDGGSRLPVQPSQDGDNICRTESCVTRGNIVSALIIETSIFGRSRKDKKLSRFTIYNSYT